MLHFAALLFTHVTGIHFIALYGNHAITESFPRNLLWRSFQGRGAHVLIGAQ